MNDLINAIESILFVAGRPVKLSEIIAATKTEKDEVISALKQLAARKLSTGIILLEKNEKYQLVSAPANAKVVGDFVTAELREKLSDASVEALSIIAYKQPITRAEIETIRGVNSQYILRQLLIRGLIEKNHSSEDSRRIVYSTSIEFMAYLGIQDMKQLPDFEELTKNVTLPQQGSAQPNNNDQQLN